ncbi:MAG: hypothetical protein WCB68_22395 [Pyrinomonadaceae bacterium]
MKKIVMFMFVLATLIATTPIATRADVQDRLFDFTDEYYLQNGVDPTLIVNRRQGVAPRGTIDAPFFPFQRNVRTLQLNPAYNQSGSPVYWTVMGDLFVSSFTKDEAGTRARQIADNMPLYVFPTRTGNPIGLGNNRQADIVDMRNGYFSNNPLGLWLHIWVSYTDRAFNTSDGKKALADLQKKNGLALDGTPIIKTLSELENLFSKGFAAKRFRNPDGSEGPMYGICPVTKDPTDGGIPTDTTLAFVRKTDGTPLEPYFVTNFDSLKFTGDWAK